MGGLVGEDLVDRGFNSIDSSWARSWKVRNDGLKIWDGKGIKSGGIWLNWIEQWALGGDGVEFLLQVITPSGTGEGLVWGVNLKSAIELSPKLGWVALEKV